MQTTLFSKRQATPVKPGIVALRSLAVLIVLFWSAVVLVPLAVLLSVALKSPVELLNNPLGWPAQFVWSNFAEAWNNAALGQAFFNSMLITSGALLGLIVCGAMAAYPLARFTGPWSRRTYTYFVAGLIVPFQLGLFPLYKEMHDLALINTYQGAILLYIAVNLPFVIFLYTGFIKTVPRELEDSLSHEFLMQALAEHIHDGRFLRLIQGLLQAGYLEEWRYHATLSGAPQGGIVSPILSTIYLSKLDHYVEKTLIPMYTKGARRKKNRAYDTLLSQGYRLRQRGRYAEAAKARKAAQKLPSVDLKDPDYRRLRFARYADDWLLGLIGTKEEAEHIKEQIKTFLPEELNLELSDEKTLITHARTEAARFLSYQISASQDDTCQTKKKRSVNGEMRLRVPPDLLKKKRQKYQRNNKPIPRKELTNNTVYSIVAQYQSEFRGIAEYYQLANDLHRLNSLKWIMEQSLAKTLATKLKTTVKKVHKKYGAIWTSDGKTHTGFQVTVPREGKKPLIAKWGGISLKRRLQAILNDQPSPFWPNRSELEKRLLADTCELCGSTDRVEVHHIRALKDLEQKGRQEKPLWAKVMSARRRKTLVVCWSCHRSIHAGRPVIKLQT